MTGTPAIYRVPSVPCKHAGHDGTRRGDAASSEHCGWGTAQAPRRQCAWEERTPREGEAGL